MWPSYESFMSIEEEDKYLESSWVFDTSEGFEFDALVFAGGKGSFYIKDKNDPDGIVHEMLFVGLGLTKSKGPIPFGIGGQFSTPDMYSVGLDPLETQKPGGILKLEDFQGVHTGVVISGTLGVIGGASLSMVFFGTYSKIARGLIFSREWTAPGGGATIMPVIFTIDP
jgi:hypothetical protein